MSRKCIVLGCAPQPGEFLTFHRIPIDEYKKQIWLDQLELPSTSTGRVCSKHFVPSDYILKSNGRHLKPCSYPQCVQTDNVELANDDETGDKMNIQYICDANMYDESAYDSEVSKMYLNQIINKEHSYAKPIRNSFDDEYQDAKPSAALLAKSLEDYVQDDDAYYYDESSRRNQLYWTTDATKTLIKLRGDRESEFEQGGARKSQLWVDICRRMRSLGYDFTPEKVSKKWHNILITYNKNLSKKQHSGQVNWEFFDDIDAVFKNRRLEIESSSSYQEDSPPLSVPTAPKRRATAEISFFEIEKLNNRVSSEPSSTMQVHEIEDEKEDLKKFKFNPEEEFSNCNGEADRIWWKDYFEQKLELEKEKLQKEHERHKDNINFQKMALIQDKLKVEAINSLTSAIKEYTRLAEAKQDDD